MNKSLLVLTAVLVKAFSCPDYDFIAQQSVDSQLYSPQLLDGLWYMLATNEPTLPPICNCPRNNFTTSPAESTYTYTNIDLCEVTGELEFHVDGKLVDEGRPGLMKEHARYSPLRMKTNMAFHALYGPDGDMTHIYTYACLAPNVFSFTLMGRSAKDETAETIQEMVDAVDELTKNVLDVTKLKITTGEDFDLCENKN